MPGLLIPVPCAETLPPGVDQATATLGLLHERAHQRALLPGWQAFQLGLRDLGVPEVGGPLFYRFPPRRRMVTLDPDNRQVETDARVRVAGFVEPHHVDRVTLALGFLAGTADSSVRHLDTRERAWRVVEDSTTHYAVDPDFFDAEGDHVSAPLTIDRPVLPTTEELQQRMEDVGFSEAMRQVPAHVEAVSRELGRATLSVGRPMPLFVIACD